jgi:hypothetical protein
LNGGATTMLRWLQFGGLHSKKNLQRGDIVGKQVKFIYRSPWYVEEDGFGGCTTLVELNDGIVFELQNGSFDQPILQVRPDKSKYSRCSEPYLEACIGKGIVEVVTCDCWPSFGLLLSNDYLLYQSDFPNADRTGALLIGPYADALGQTYDRSDIMPYWGINFR